MYAECDVWACRPSLRESDLFLAVSRLSIPGIGRSSRGRERERESVLHEERVPAASAPSAHPFSLLSPSNRRCPFVLRPP